MFLSSPADCKGEIWYIWRWSKIEQSLRVISRLKRLEKWSPGILTAFTLMGGFLWFKQNWEVIAVPSAYIRNIFRVAVTGFGSSRVIIKHIGNNRLMESNQCRVWLYHQEINILLNITSMQSSLSRQSTFLASLSSLDIFHHCLKSADFVPDIINELSTIRLSGAVGCRRASSSLIFL